MLDWLIVLSGVLIVCLIVIFGSLTDIRTQLEDLHWQSERNYDLPSRIELEATVDELFKQNQQQAETLARWNYDNDKWQKEVDRAKEDTGEIVTLEGMLR